MKLSQQSFSSVEVAVKQAVLKYDNPGGIEPNVVTDIHFQPNPTSGELVIYDDDNELSSVIVDEWVSYESDDFESEVARVLISLLNRMKNEGAFEHLTIMEPYSFVLVDEERETIKELLLMDNDTYIVNDELLKGLDEELDTFLRDLLK